MQKAQNKPSAKKALRFSLTKKIEEVLSEMKEDRALQKTRRTIKNAVKKITRKFLKRTEKTKIRNRKAQKRKSPHSSENKKTRVSPRLAVNPKNKDQRS